ncbi:GNAT family N-acetyltransferase [Roseixanthobacter pseudopolyaromaticivorans]|uniref:GNAT family N-acetyltransferase n=1 Tax=Xanthobacteraceae TaxID=335928 RepID=UPI002BF30232|nr:GNAT family N-acetyltransferase [Hyphomicrobium zavarzinii]
MTGKDVHEEPETGRFVLELDGETVFADCERKAGLIAIHHVYAPPSLRGTGAADRLMTGIAAQARDEGTRIVGHCRYADAWLRQSAEYRDLLAAPSRRRDAHAAQGD